MSSPPSKPSPWRKLGKFAGVLLAVLALLTGAVLWYMTTDSFRSMVARRLVAQIERITGGRADIGSVGVSPFHLRVELSDLTIHGLEKPGEAPYLHIDQLVANLKITSFLRADFGFRYIVVDHPTLHLVIYEDGTTNLPSPKVETPRPGISELENLFAISINRVDVRHGTLLLGSQEYPLDFSISDFSADTSYSLLHRRYDANILLGRAETRFAGFQPIAWTAELHASLEHNLIDLKSLKLGSNGAHFEASGHVRDFLEPKVDGIYSGSLDLARAGVVTRRSDLRGGTVDLKGQGTWSAKEFSFTGTVAGDSLAWRIPDLSLRNAKLSAQYSIDRDNFSLSKIQGRVFDGSVAGDASVANWRGQKAPKSRNSDPTGTARFKLSGLSISELAESVSTQRRPLNRIGLAGSGSGTLDLRWKGTVRNADVQVAMDVAAPPPGSPGRLPLNARARLTYYGSREELEVSDFTASTSSTHMRASGALAVRSNLKLSVSTSNLGDVEPVMIAFGGPSKLPVKVHGTASFEGFASGKLSAPSLGGQLQLNDFEATLPANSRTPEQQVHWDDLAANFQYSPASLIVRNGELHHGAMQVSFGGSVGLQHGRMSPSASLSARVDAHHADVAEWLRIAGLDYPVQGTADAHIEFTGTNSSPHAKGNFQVTNATVYGRDLRQFNSRVEYVNDEVNFTDLTLSRGDEHLGGQFAYNLATHTIRFDLRANGVDLAPMPGLAGSTLNVQGRSDFTARGAGTLEAPVLNANVRLRGVTVNGQELGDSTFDATTQGADLHLTGHSQLQQAQMSTEGTIHLRGDWPCNIKLHFSQISADPLLRIYMKGRINSHSLIDGDLLLEGPLRRPRELKITGDFNNVALGLGDLDIKNDGPVRFSINNQLLTIEPFHFTGERTDLTGSGTAQLAGDHRLNLHTRGRVNLRLIQTLNHDFTSFGIVTVDLNITGTAAAPVTQGRFEIKNGSIAYVDLPSALSEINGSLVFNQDRVQIETLTAKTGGGEVRLEGYATARNRQFTFDVSAHGEQVRLRYPPGISSTANMDLRFAGTPKASTLSGDVTINRLAMSPGFDFATYLARSGGASLPQTDPLLNSIRLDVHIVTTPELQMQTTTLRLSGDADVRLRGTAAKPTLLGRADITEGELYFNGTKFHLERGEVSFLGPSGIRPSLDLQMSTRVRDYDITVSLTGEPDKLKLQYRSEPPLAEADIVSLLALGRTREESAQQQGNSVLGTEASNAILAGALNAAVSNRVQSLFGGSRIKIDPQGLSTVTTPARGPQVTIEQQVTNNLTVTYSTNVSQATQQIIQMEYNISRNLSVVAVRDQNGVVSFDVRIRQRKK